ncbi:Ubiquitin-related modifier 1 [Saitozyma sp. JCM 24511]|nr:Ubiquitin-related modifier 1 [Saitozyma sp. JCM 24511]
MSARTEEPELPSNGLGYQPRIPSPKPLGYTSSPGPDTLEIRLEFGGGLHLLFSQQPRHSIHVPRHVPGSSPPKPSDMRYLIRWLKGNLLSEREEMFGEGDGVRPGILVLINDADWELEGELEYELRDRDEVVFISTLHGG